MEFGSKERKIGCLVYEALGTACIVFTILLGQPERGYAYVSMTVLWMCICDNVTGGHFNPAITICMWLSSKKLKDNVVPMMFMIAGQFIGMGIGLLWAWLAMCDYTYLNNISDVFGVDREATIPLRYIAPLAPFIPGTYTPDIGNFNEGDYTRYWQCMFGTLISAFLASLAFA